MEEDDRWGNLKGCKMSSSVLIQTNLQQFRTPFAMALEQEATFDAQHSNS
jgi:hypothetical protein